MREGTWLHRGERTIYDSEWVRLAVADVVLPDGRRIDHHVVRLPGPAAGTLAVVDGVVLLQYRHRFITDTWGWEIPAGRVDPGESPLDAARREALEETGWEPLALEPLCRFPPANGLLDQVYVVFLARGAVHRGDPEDPNEAAEVAWVPIDEVRRRLRDGEIGDGLSFGALAFAFATGVL